MHISADFFTKCEKFLFQLKALQKRVQHDVNRFIVPQVVPEIYMKNERLKNRGDVFFCYRLYIKSLKALLSQSSAPSKLLFLKAPISQGSSLSKIHFLLNAPASQSPTFSMLSSFKSPLVKAPLSQSSTFSKLHSLKALLS